MPTHGRGGGGGGGRVKWPLMAGWEVGGGLG